MTEHDVGGNGEGRAGRVTPTFDPSVLPERLERVAAAMLQPGSSVLLVGDSGAGKLGLAQSAAHLLETELGIDIQLTVLSPPPPPSSGLVTVFGFQFPEILESVDGQRLSRLPEPQVLADRLGEAVLRRAQGRSPVIIAPNVHEYPPLLAYLLEHLVRAPEIRVVATAQRLTGAADRMMRDPRVKRLSIGPLSTEEADRYLSSLLGVSQVAPATLQMWLAASAGNSYALGVLALSADRRGELRRGRGIAWVPPGLESAPTEFAEFAAEICTEEEMRALEMIAQGEPLTESVLLRLIHPDCVRTLLERGLVTMRRLPGGDMSLETAHPILATAVRERIPAERRVEIGDEFFGALSRARLESTLHDTPQQLTRLVIFGLESGKQMPFDWLHRTFEFLATGVNPRLLVRVALELMRVADRQEAAIAAVRCASYTRLLGDAASWHATQRHIERLVADEEADPLLPAPLHARLRLLQIEDLFWAGVDTDTLMADLTALEARFGESDTVAQEMVRSVAMTLLAYAGRLNDAKNLAPELTICASFEVEWVRSPARAVHALILQQAGRFEEALNAAEHARQFALLGTRAAPDGAELQGFCWFFGFWASGSRDAGREVIDELSETFNGDTYSVAYFSGFLEVAEALLAIQEGRWRDAADMSQQLLEQLRAFDGYGLSPLLHAITALALAAIGENEEAIRAHRRALRVRRGVAQAIDGFRRRLLVRAQQWLRHGNPAEEAARLAEWARAEKLPLVELEALHIVACESRAGARGVAERAREIATQVDPPFGEVILSHIEKIAAGIPAAAVSEPEVRLLAELGLWMPLPAVRGLSAREREIALLGSLGYSAKFIADRFHLSVRTVDTHLGHVYSKLGVVDRDGLRSWFSAEREFEGRDETVAPTTNGLGFGHSNGNGNGLGNSNGLGNGRVA